MMREISLLKSVEEIYIMSDIWVFHVSDDAFISRHASFPMPKTGSTKKPEAKKTGSKKKTEAKKTRKQKKTGSKKVIANDTESKLPGYCVVVVVVVVVVVSYSLMCTR